MLRELNVVEQRYRAVLEVAPPAATSGGTKPPTTANKAVRYSAM
jgi:hypothetical protein